MIYKQGQIIGSIQLLQFEGEFRRKADGVRIFPVAVKDRPDDGRDHAYYEVWSVLNLNTGTVQQKKLPIFVYKENPDDYSIQDRKEFIDDTDEVTSLLDSYECWYTKVRDRKNFHLDIINDRHINQIERLRQLDANETDINFRVGIRLKLVMKEHPNTSTRRMFIQWGKDFPALFTKLSKHVYENIVISAINDSTIDM